MNTLEASESVGEGERLLKKGLFDRSRNAFLKARDLDRDSAKAPFRLAQVAMRQNNYEVALLFGAEALSLDPDNAWIHILLGNAHRALFCFSKSAHHYEIAARLRPDLEQPWYGLARIAARAGIDELKLRLQECRKLQAPDFHLCTAIAWQHLKAGEKSSAVEILESLGTEKLSDRQLVKLAELFSRCGEAEISRELIRKFIARGNPDPFRFFLESEMNPEHGLIILYNLLRKKGSSIYSDLVFGNVLRARSIRAKIRAHWLKIRWGKQLSVFRRDISSCSLRRLAYDTDYGLDERCRPSEGELVSLLCPIHRPEDITNLTSQLNGLDWRRKEAVILVNGNNIKVDEIRNRLDAGAFERIEFIHEPGKYPVGHLLNSCLRVSTGEFIARIDADDFYGPAYLQHGIAFMKKKKADLIGKSDFFCYLEERDETFLIRRRKTTENAKAPVGTGSTIFFHRSVLSKVRFDASTHIGEDLDFFNAVREAGFSVYTAPPFDHIVMRKSVKDRHTWQSFDCFLFSDECLLLGRGLKKACCVL
jgi:tetratricopeptide (TPR) repeat protein